MFSPCRRFGHDTVDSVAVIEGVKMWQQYHRHEARQMVGMLFRGITVASK